MAKHESLRVERTYSETRKKNQLPPKAKNWVKEREQQIIEDMYDSAAPEFHKRRLLMHAKFEEMGLNSEPSIITFRNLHSLAVPDSIASLPIDNNLLLDLIWNDVYYISDLEARLTEPSKLKFTRSIYRKEQILENLRTTVTEERKLMETSLH